jgi:TRAP transporter TAXI family solute receptor
MVQLVTRAMALALLALAACARGPDATDMQAALQKQLDDALGGRVLIVERLTRAGGAPLKGRDGRLVYYNAQLTLARDYDFTKWDTHSVASLANLLGAGPKGIIGLAADGNKAGDKLGVYGTAAFSESDGRFTLLPATPADLEASEAALPAAVVAVKAPVREMPPPTPAHAALAKLQELFAVPTARELPQAERESVLEEEFRETYARARARLDRAAKVIVIAGGPEGGAYAEVLRAIEARADGADVLVRGVSSEGSLGNLRLLDAGTAQFAIAQNDIARNAYNGTGRFAGAPQPELRAVASLFPEPIHVVVRADSKIASVADLRGKRVDLGLEGSGTRANARAILSVTGVPESALAEARASALPQAAKALAEGRIDAFFATINAPAHEIVRLASRIPIALVPIGPSRELLDTGLVPLTLPALTYPGQRAPVPVLAATAMLVTRDDVAPATVAAVMRLLFEVRGGPTTAAVSRIHVAQAREGVGLPFHAQAETYLAASATARKPATAR